MSDTPTPPPNPQQVEAFRNVVKATLAHAIRLLEMTGPLHGALITVVVSGPDPLSPISLSNARKPEDAETPLIAAAAQYKAAGEPKLHIAGADDLPSNGHVADLRALREKRE